MTEADEPKLDFTLKELAFSGKAEDVPGSSATVELRPDRLVCVEYPAVVTSVDKMLETLGGQQNVSKVGSNDFFFYVVVFLKVRLFRCSSVLN